MQKYIDQVTNVLDEPELLCQLAEEAAELGQAALKLRRALTGDNPTPVTVDEAQRALVEEIADVALCLDALGMDTNNRALMLSVVRTKNKKSQRWAKRIMKGGIE